MELKTLKDLAFEDKLGGWIVRTDEARQEAINHIKDIEKRHKQTLETIDKICGKEHSENRRAEISLVNGKRNGTIDWIKHFFNIKDEDLK